MYGPLLKYRQFSCISNPFPANAFLLIKSGRLSIARPSPPLHRYTHKHACAQLLSPWMNLEKSWVEGNRGNCISVNLLVRTAVHSGDVHPLPNKETKKTQHAFMYTPERVYISLSRCTQLSDCIFALIIMISMTLLSHRHCNWYLYSHTVFPLMAEQIFRIPRLQHINHFWSDTTCGHLTPTAYLWFPSHLVTIHQEGRIRSW